MSAFDNLQSTKTILFTDRMEESENNVSELGAPPLIMSDDICTQH